MSPDPQELRALLASGGTSRTAQRRWVQRALAVGGLLIALLLLWTLWPRADDRRTVLLVAPEGARIEVDGRPHGSPATDGTYLLRLSPGRYELRFELRGGARVEQALEVPPGREALSVELRPQRGKDAWVLRTVSGGPVLADERQ